MASNFVQKFLNPSERGRAWRFFFVIVLIVIVGTLIVEAPRYNRFVDAISAKTGSAVSLPKVKEIPFRLGLDLQGGTHLEYKADLQGIVDAEKASALEGVRDVVERRVNAFGVSEPLVQINKTEERLIVELAGIKDVEEAIDMIGATPLLEFKEQLGSAADLTPEERKTMDDFNKKAEEKANEVLGKLTKGGDFAALAKEFSQDEKTKDAGGKLNWITEKDNPEIFAAATGLKVGQISNKLVKTSAGFEILKLEEKRKKANPFNDQEVEKEVRASHILICYKGSEKCDKEISKEEAYAKIKRVKDELNTKNFTELAKKYSDEPGADVSGGDLGWFGRSAMVKPFEDAVFEQKVDSISYVVETMFGYHLIYKQAERDVEELNVSHILFGTISEEAILNEKQDWKKTELTGKYLKKARVQVDSNDFMPRVVLEFDDEGKKMFEDITERNVGKQVAIFLDGEIISQPTVNEKISGNAEISGTFTDKEAATLAQRLNAGALPVPIKLISQQNIGASLGRDSLDSTVKAGLIGFLLVALFMILFYRLPGILADFSLAIYVLIVLSIFKLLNITLTLSGMAGLILSIGMAVDANILIFSRMREELEAGRSLSSAIEEGFKRAWLSIRDSNFFTMITCVILILFSSSVVKGFAVTLLIGVSVSMFSAIVITKNFLRLVSANWLEKRKWLVGAKSK